MDLICIGTAIIRHLMDVCNFGTRFRKYRLTQVCRQLYADNCDIAIEIESFEDDKKDVSLVEE